MKKMIFFSFPIFLGNLLQSSYQIIDSLWIGNLLGAQALGAVSVSSTIIFTVLAFIIGINSSTLTVLSQRTGAKDMEGLRISLNAFVFVLGVLALLLGLFGFFMSSSILRWMGTPESILPMAAAYLKINFLGILLLFGYNFIGTVLRAVGDSRTPLRFISLAVVLNIVLDPLFIAGFQWGIEGAAVATVVSQGAAFLYGLIYSIRAKGLPFTVPTPPPWEEFTRIFRLGLPSGFSMMVISGGMLAIMTVVTSFGENAIAGYGAAQRLDSLIMLPATTLGSAITSMSGQNIGAGKWERVSDIAKNGLILILTVTLAIALVVFLLSELFIRMFVSDPATIAFGSTYLKIVAFFYPFLGINFVLNGVVRASGAMVQVLVLNTLSFWVLRFPLSWGFSTWIGENGIAVGIGVSFVISSLLAIGYYRFGKWRQIDLFHYNEKNKETATE